jgi:hypothetical protein
VTTPTPASSIAPHPAPRAEDYKDLGATPEVGGYVARHALVGPPCGLSPYCYHADDPNFATAGELFEVAEREGFAPPVIPKNGFYFVTVIEAAPVGDTALKYRMQIEHGEDGEFVGKVFDTFKLNWTPKGIRRTVGILRKWGIVPTANDDIKTVAEMLLGRQAIVRTEQREFNGLVFVDLGEIQLTGVRK